MNSSQYRRGFSETVKRKTCCTCQDVNITFLMCRNMFKTLKLILDLEILKWNIKLLLLCGLQTCGRMWVAPGMTVFHLATKLGRVYHRPTHLTLATDPIWAFSAATRCNCVAFAVSSIGKLLAATRRKKKPSSNVLSKQNVIGRFVEDGSDGKCFMGKLAEVYYEAFKSFWLLISTGLTMNILLLSYTMLMFPTPR